MVRNKLKRVHSKIFSAVFANIFFTTTIFISAFPLQAQTVTQPVLNLPPVGSMLNLTEDFYPVLVKGMTIHPNDPLKFDFILDTGSAYISDEKLREESLRLAKYFLATLTVPEEELWVNLSPYEKDNMIPAAFGETEMGRDLLAQDYILKQLTASLIYPEKDLGDEFWKRVYAKAQAKFGTTDIPLNTFNKIWIVPDQAAVYEQGSDVFIINSHLKVLLEQDYKALQTDDSIQGRKAESISQETKDISTISSDVVREVLIPEIEKEVNSGKNFAGLRQIYSTMILAAWYKEALRESLVGQVYVDQKKTFGVDNEDEAINQKIYEQYLQAFKQGVYDIVKEEYDPANREVVSRRYFSGGAHMTVVVPLVRKNTVRASSPAEISDPEERTVVMKSLENIQNPQGNLKRVSVGIAPRMKSLTERSNVARELVRLNLEAAGVSNAQKFANDMTSSTQKVKINNAMTTLSEPVHDQFVMATALGVAPQMMESRPELIGNALTGAGYGDSASAVLKIRQNNNDVEEFLTAQPQENRQEIAGQIVQIASREGILTPDDLAASLQKFDLPKDQAQSIARKITDTSSGNIDGSLTELPAASRQEFSARLAQSALDISGGLQENELMSIFRGENVKNAAQAAKTIRQGQRNLDLDISLDKQKIATPNIRTNTMVNLAAIGVGEKTLTLEKIEIALVRAGVKNAPQVAQQITAQLSGKTDPIDQLSARLSPAVFEKVLSQFVVSGIQTGALVPDEQFLKAQRISATPEMAAQLSQVKTVDGLNNIFSNQSSVGKSEKTAALVNLARSVINTMDAPTVTEQLQIAGVESSEDLAKEITSNKGSVDLPSILKEQNESVRATAIRELAQATVAERNDNELNQDRLARIFVNSGQTDEQANAIAANIINGRDATNINKVLAQTNLSPDSQQKIASKLASGYINSGNLVAARVDVETAKPSDVGGIDFNPSMLVMDVQKDGLGVPLPISQQPLMNIPLDGFSPVINEITPIEQLFPTG
jgi:hypothetical protein